MPRTPKPVSPKRLAANRANAAQSTGPRTPEGKARSARNSVKHGFAASAFAVVRLEDVHEVDHLTADLVAVYQPANSQELLALQRMAIAQQSILRAARLESGLFTTCLNETLDSNDHPSLPMNAQLEGDGDIEITRAQNRNYLLGEGFLRLARQSNGWTLFLRYQAQAERQYRRALEDFERIKALRPNLPTQDLPTNNLPNEPISPPQPQHPSTTYTAPATNPSPSENAPAAAAPPQPCRRPRPAARPHRAPAPTRPARPSLYNGLVPRLVLPLILALSRILSAQSAYFPLKDVRAGMHATGRTVFSGNRVEEFQAEILGVLDNFGPKESLILARLSGGPLEHTGVMEGMSGSPVYIDGKLAGAVAMAFPFAKDPIAGIRPIEEMIRATSTLTDSAPPAAPRSPAGLLGGDLTGALPRLASASAGQPRMVEIATPLSFSGFTRATLDTFAPQLRSLGLDPRQAVSAGGVPGAAMGNPADLKPGSMISVQLLAGDLSLGAAGTVTAIEGSRIYAFGHRFLAVGATALPFARAEVVTLLPNINTSFKLVTTKEWMGTVSQDRESAVSGVLGRRAPMAPVSIAVSRNGRPVQSYQFEMVDDPLLSPLLLQMAVFSAIDSTERSVGAASVRVSGEIEFAGAPTPVLLDNLYSADNGASTMVALTTALPMAFVMQSGFRSISLKKATLRVEAYDRKKQLTIDSVTASRREIHPGEKLRLSVLMLGDDGAETTRQVDYQVPIGAEPGPLYFTVADAGISNIADFRQTLLATPRTIGQLIGTVNNLHPNNKAYVRVWRAEPAFQFDGADLPAPPPSATLVLEGSAAAGIAQSRNSKIGEIELDGDGMVISGVKTIQVEIKE